MEILRVVLFLGLVLHKLVWVLLKRGGGLSSKADVVAQRSWTTFAVKAFKGLILFLLACQTLFWNLLPISDQPESLRIIGVTIYLIGLSMAILGRFQLGQNWIDLEDYRVLAGQSLVTHGIYRYVRHPIYTGDLLLLLGLELALNSWLVLGVCIPLLIVLRQAMAEEALLAQAFPGYDAYRARTGRFLPFFL
jgi:protein-S-isoprenylcysteine O-methyltransferase Ste14